MRRALKAVEMGWSPTAVVEPTVFAESGWMGEESAHWQEKIDAFSGLRRDGEDVDPGRERIIAAGIECFEMRRAAAAERERRERTFGSAGAL